MFKVIKIGELIYQNIKPFYVDEHGNEVWNIPNDLEELRACVIDTFNWLIGQEVKKQSGGDFTKLSAANSKLGVLLVKIVDTLNPDLTNLTENEKVIWDTAKQFAVQRYSDSELLKNLMNAVLNNISVYSTKIEQAQQATTTDELIKLLEE